jgi:hypothetical protein
MAGTTRTEANIPEEYKYLSQETGSTLAALQKYLWGQPTEYGGAVTPPGGGGTPDLPPGPGTKDPTTGPGIGDAPLDNAPPAAAPPRKELEPGVGDLGYNPMTLQPYQQSNGQWVYGTEGFPYEGLAGTNQAGMQWLQPNPERIADLNQGMKEGFYAGSRIEGAGTPQYQEAGNQMYNAARTGMQDASDLVNFENNPLLKASMQAFQTNALPMLQNQNELSGFGHTNVAGRNIADAFAGQVVVPAMQSALQTKGEALTRGMQGQQAMGQTQMDIGRQLAGQTKQAADTLWGQGAQYRTEVQQPALTAAKKEADAQKSFAQQVLLSPLGNFVPASIGSSTTGK